MLLWITISTSTPRCPSIVSAHMSLRCAWHWLQLTPCECRLLVWPIRRRYCWKMASLFVVEMNNIIGYYTCSRYCRTQCKCMDNCFVSLFEKCCVRMDVFGLEKTRYEWVIKTLFLPVIFAFTDRRHLYAGHTISIWYWLHNLYLILVTRGLLSTTTQSPVSTVGLCPSGQMPDCMPNSRVGPARPPTYNCVDSGSIRHLCWQCH